MTRAELKQLIDTSDDIMFHNKEKAFTILTCFEEQGIIIGIQHKRGEVVAPEECFATADELIDGYMIDGVPLADKLPSMEIDSYA